MATYGFILGEALLPPAVAAAMGWLDWREIWYCAAAAVVLLALPALVGLARPLVGHIAPEDSDADDVDDSVRSRRSLFVNARFLRVLSVAGVSQFVVTAVFLHQGTLAERLDWSLAAVASGFVLFAGMQAVAAFAGGGWSTASAPARCCASICCRWVWRCFHWACCRRAFRCG
jgi:uncharacterized oligopeptide transporter (OPT) family protein